MKITLAEALLRRKELQQKVDVLKHIKDRDLFEVKASRKPVADGIDDIVAQVPKLEVNQVTKEFDWHARQLRMIDAIVQRTNWSTEIDVDDIIMSDFK